MAPSTGAAPKRLCLMVLTVGASQAAAYLYSSQAATDKVAEKDHPIPAGWPGTHAVYQPLTLTAGGETARKVAAESFAFSFNANTTMASAQHRDEPDCRSLLGLPKFTWALLCDILALALVLLCVPLLLTCSRRRPPGAPLFDCSCGPVGSGGTFDTHSNLKAAPWLP
eukprot:gnl/TRDRNA2_/TRDRNA2_178479_c0_seq1.p1 gnl/TRDRNA2_/TRDRNA2_178479_c0~~gnl/TRDRNA2_/TRDRNA2_178479_c0_seq1.p1  ORF type:complete len:168 (+),score=23.38 gnl/TRDRNA2_/TRDRNA2_178479_c0_seq1:68-571(+)